MLYLVAAVIAYCLGSISTGILVSKMMHGPDLRTVGSKNTGATNVQRTMGWGPGLLTFAGDSLKAVLACWIGQLITGSYMGALFCGVFVVIGHNWPVFLNSRAEKV
jgi:glycerol-3-phosphate acyltransferase PlsY